MEWKFVFSFESADPSEKRKLAGAPLPVLAEYIKSMSELLVSLVAKGAPVPVFRSLTEGSYELQADPCDEGTAELWRRLVHHDLDFDAFPKKVGRAAKRVDRLARGQRAVVVARFAEESVSYVLSPKNVVRAQVDTYLAEQELLVRLVGVRPNADSGCRLDLRIDDSLYASVRCDIDPTRENGFEQNIYGEWWIATCEVERDERTLQLLRVLRVLRLDPEPDLEDVLNAVAVDLRRHWEEHPDPAFFREVFGESEGE
jgi:hypothetical protein